MHFNIIDLRVTGMKKVCVFLRAFVSLSLSTMIMTTAWAGGLSCETLKEKIAKKVDGKGVKNYQLTIVDKETETKNRVVGTCEGGTKKIIYEKVKANIEEK